MKSLNLLTLIALVTAIEFGKRSAIYDIFYACSIVILEIIAWKLILSFINMFYDSYKKEVLVVGFIFTVGSWFIIFWHIMIFIVVYKDSRMYN